MNILWLSNEFVDIKNINYIEFENSILKTKKENQIEYISNLLESNIKISFYAPKTKAYKLSIYIKNDKNKFNYYFSNCYTQKILKKYHYSRFINLNLNDFHSNFIQFNLQTHMPYPDEIYFMIRDKHFKFSYHMRYGIQKYVENSLGIFAKYDNGWRFFPCCNEV